MQTKQNLCPQGLKVATSNSLWPGIEPGSKN